MMTGRAYGRALMGALASIAMGCNADDAPPCLKAAGELETHHFTFQQPLEVLNTQGHMQVSYETWDSSAVAVQLGGSQQSFIGYANGVGWSRA